MGKEERNKGEKGGKKKKNYNMWQNRAKQGRQKIWQFQPKYGKIGQNGAKCSKVKENKGKNKRSQEEGEVEGKKKEAI